MTASGGRGTWISATSGTTSTYPPAVTTSNGLIASAGAAVSISTYLSGVNGGLITPFTPYGPDYLMSTLPGVGKLTPPQLAQLLRDHTFIEMDNSDFCLFCYALDQYRPRTDHIFVISEE